MALKSILVKQREKSHSSNRLECGVCKQRFWMTCKYMDHLANHKHFLLSCNICNKAFYDQKKLDDHYICHKEVINTFDCNQCTRKFLQKYQLEQHMQFHLNPITLSGSTVKKKTVHVNSIFQSRDTVESFSDDDDDDDFEDYRPFSKLTKTRSGRIVKAKKLFDDEPETKRRRKSSNEVCAETSDGTLSPGQPPRLETANKLNAVQVMPSNKSSSSADSSILSTQIIDKELRVVVERIPEHVFKKYVSKGNVCTYDISKIQKSSNTSVSNNSQTVAPNNSLMENDKKGSKVISTKNSSVTIDSSISELAKYFNQKISEDNSNISAISTCAQSSEISNFNQCDNATVMSKTSSHEAKIAGTMINVSRKSDLASNKNINAVVTACSLQSPTKPALNYSSQANKINPIEKPLLTSSSSKRMCASYSHTLPRVDQQFLYVGPKQGISKIKTIIDEMKAMSNLSVNNSEGKLIARDKNSGSSQNVCNKSPQIIQNLNMDNLGTSTSTGPLSITSKNVDNTSRSTNNMKSTGESPIGNGLSEFECKDGILEKKIVKDFILIKVTPEYMQKMQQETLQSQQLKHKNSESFNVVKSESHPANILPVSSGLNKDISKTSLLNEVTQISKTIKAKNVHVSQISPKVYSVTSVSNTADPPVKAHGEICQNLESLDSVVMQKVTSVNSIGQMGKIPSQNAELNNLHNEKCTQTSSKSELISVSSQKEKLLERYRAKIKEKECKKREKYEFKKKMRYMEKILCIDNPNTAISTKKKSELANTIITNKYNKGTSVRKETDNDKDTQLIKILVENAVLAHKSNKQLLPTDVQELKSKLDYLRSNISCVTDETFTTECPCDSAESSDSSMNCTVAKSSSSVDFGSDKHPTQLQILKFKEQKFTEEEAVQNAYNISLKFEKKLSEKEYLNLLDELDNLITSFNISKKCPFLFPIIRFCRLYVESYKVKERAISLQTKIVQND